MLRFQAQSAVDQGSDRIRRTLDDWSSEAEQRWRALGATFDRHDADTMQARADHAHHARLKDARQLSLLSHRARIDKAQRRDEQLDARYDQVVDRVSSRGEVLEVTREQARNLRDRFEVAQDEQEKRVLMRALAASAELALRGKMGQSKGHLDPMSLFISLPANVRFQDIVDVVATFPDLYALSRQALNGSATESQLKAAAALDIGLAPHPVHLGRILQDHGKDADWAEQFGHFAKRWPTPQNALSVRARRLEVASPRQYRSTLSAYGEDRLLTMIRAPHDLDRATPALPSQRLGLRTMSNHDLATVLDTLWRQAKETSLR